MNESLHEALRRAADDTAFGSHTSGQDLLRRARRRQAHHHVLTVAAAVTVVVAAAGAAAAMLPRLLDPHQAPVAVQSPAETVPGSARILTRCAAAFDDRDEELSTEPRLFGPRAKVITADVSKAGTAAFILGSNRQFYAECNLSPHGGDDWIHEYNVDAAPAGGQNTVYGISTFTYRDRFPADVATVRIDLYGDGTVSAPTAEGFVALARSTHGQGPRHVTLLDNTGQVLASAPWGQLPAAYDSLLPAARR
jgi:hypothetical protein